jgi:GT2 family glycosyltransferase
MEVDWATGASVMLRLTALREVGLFDEGFFLYHEEIELMWRLRKAEWAIATEPRSRVRHVGGGSTGVHDRGTNDSAKPQKPPYWYRSRSRYFGLTRGRATVLLAYFAWILGYSLWKIRRLVNLAPNARPVAHEMRDHLLHAFPRRDDVFPAVMPATGTAREKPMWMENKWL